MISVAISRVLHPLLPATTRALALARGAGVVGDGLVGVRSSASLSMTYASSKSPMSITTPLVSVPSVLSSASASASPTTTTTMKTISSGGLVNDELIESLLGPCLEEANGNYILDGYPRSGQQARKLVTEQVTSDSTKPQLVIQFDIPTSVLQTRVHTRRLCKLTGRSFNISQISPSSSSSSSSPSSLHLVRRPDDHPDVFANRLKTYQNSLPHILSAFHHARVPVVVVRPSPHADVTTVANAVFDVMCKRRCSRVVFLGPPGAGKGSVADVLKTFWKHDSLFHISTGDLLRQYSSSSSSSASCF